MSPKSQSSKLIVMVNYNGKHGPAGPGDEVPDTWPKEFVEELVEQGAVGSPQKWGQTRKRLEGDQTDVDQEVANNQARSLNPGLVAELEGAGKVHLPKPEEN